MVRSYAEVRALAGDALTWGEQNFLYQRAVKELKEIKMSESRFLSRANPQLANAVRSGLKLSSMQPYFDTLFPARSSSFVKSSPEASMFSPAAYLTELYREARDLHEAKSPYQLDNRRPDLALLPLSQQYLDEEMSTLSLSNELMLNSIQTTEEKTHDSVMEMFSTYRLTAATPYNQPYEAVRQSIILQDSDFSVFSKNPIFMAKIYKVSLLRIQNEISPEL